MRPSDEVSAFVVGGNSNKGGEPGREAWNRPFGRGESADFKSATSVIRDALRNIPDSRKCNSRPNENTTKNTLS